MKNVKKKKQDIFLIIIVSLFSVGAFFVGRDLGAKKPQSTTDIVAKKAQSEDKKKKEAKAKAEKAKVEKAKIEKEKAEKEKAEKAEKELAKQEARKKAAQAEAKQKQVEAEKAKKAAKEKAEKTAEKAEQKKKEAIEEATKKSKTEQTTKELPNVSKKDWNLLLINEDHPLKNDNIELDVLSNGYRVDKRIASSFEEFEQAAKKAGIDFVIVSSYRSVADQETVFNASLTEHMNAGSTKGEAEKLTREYITVPGTSEHHTGLAIDVIDEEWNKAGKGLEDSFYDSKAGKWIDEHAADFGFVIRYPADKVKITSINYEPWHLRYVGKENARYMKAHNLVLEEYLELLKK